VALIAILLATVFMFWYTHRNGTEKEKYSVYVEDEVCNVTVTEILPSKLDIYIDSSASAQPNYTEWYEENVTFYVTQELESTPRIDSEEEGSSILYHICLENCSFNWAMITFFKLYYSEGRLLRDPDWVIQIIIGEEEHFTSFFMQFETFK